MVRQIESILGAEVEQKRLVPGTRPDESEKVRYVQCEATREPATSYEDLVWKVSPPIPDNGGVVLEGCNIRLPNGQSFYSLSFHGDLDGWRRQIEQGARELGLSFGKIDGDQFILSDGEKYFLNDCVVTFD